MAERLGLGIIPGVGWRAKDIQAIAREAEDAGFDGIFAAEVSAGRAAALRDRGPKLAQG